MIHIFEPLIIQLLPSFLARVWSANASEPEAGSDRQNDPSCGDNYNEWDSAVEWSVN